MAEPFPEHRVIFELRRIGAELAAFPFVQAQRDRVSGRLTALTSFGALVYHDILAEGGDGTRREVRMVIDRILCKAELYPPQVGTGEAARRVATFRWTDPARVSVPLMQSHIGTEYLPGSLDPVVDAVAVAAAELKGKMAVRGMRRHAKHPFGRKGQAVIVEKARLAWRSALQAYPEDDYLAWLAEQQKMAEVAKVIGASFQGMRARRAEVPTRLITLDD